MENFKKRLLIVVLAFFMAFNALDLGTFANSGIEEPEIEATVVDEEEIESILENTDVPIVEDVTDVVVEEEDSQDVVVDDAASQEVLEDDSDEATDDVIQDETNNELADLEDLEKLEELEADVEAEKKAAPYYVSSGSLGYLDYLGQAVNFGIVADTMVRNGHCDTNFAVKVFTSETYGASIPNNFNKSNSDAHCIIASFGNGASIMVNENSCNMFITQDDFKAGRVLNVPQSEIRFESKANLSAAVDTLIAGASNVDKSSVTINTLGGETELNLSGLGAGTYYFWYDSSKMPQKINIKSNQTIVFYTEASNVTINGWFNDAIINGTTHNVGEASDDIASRVIFNAPNATTIKTQNTNVLDCTLIAKNADATIGRGTGWLVVKTFRQIGAQEWWGVWRGSRKTSINVNVWKTWVDGNSPKRPTSITVVLQKNGEDFKTVTLSSDKGWSYTFYDLDSYSVTSTGLFKENVYTIKEISVPGYSSSVSGNQYDGFAITNEKEPEKIVLNGEKVWSDGNNVDGIRPNSVTLYIMNGSTVEQTIVLTNGDDGVWQDSELKWTSNKLNKYDYNGREIQYTVVEANVSGYISNTTGTQSTGFVTTNTHIPEKIRIHGNKVWADANNQDGIRPDSITIYIKKGSEIVETITLTNGSDKVWQDSELVWTSQELPKYENGQAITYTAEEAPVSGYDTTMTGNMTDGFEITNTHVPEKVKFYGNKVWDDQNDVEGFRPDSITINIMKGTEIVQTITLTSGEDKVWQADELKWESNEFPKKENGQVIDYKIVEDAVANYTTSMTGTGSDTNPYVITNTHVPSFVNYEGKKVWDDENDKEGFRPGSITINVMKGTEVVETITLTSGSDNVWQDAELQWKTKDLPKYENGQEIKYTIVEAPVANYTSAKTGTGTAEDPFIITNTHIPTYIQLEGEKVWDDENDKEGFRPGTITIYIKNGQTTVETITLSSGADNVWQAAELQWKSGKLPAYENGQAISYTVEEAAVTNYQSTVQGAGTAQNPYMYIVINKHTPTYVNLSGLKTWDDANNQDGKRASSVVVKLYKKVGSGQEEFVMDTTADENTNWYYNFKDLPKYEKATLVTYRVEEVVPTGYLPVYTKTDNGWDIKNIHIPETVNLHGEKVWDDNNNQDGMRPDSIVINIIKNDTETVETITLTSGEDKVWQSAELQWKSKDLPKYENGTEIKYTVEEKAIANYSSKIEGSITNGYVITNTHTTQTVNVDGVKTWTDANNQDGMRPASITIRLLADGKEIDHVTVTQNDNWQWAFNNLPKFNNGTEIKYTITEDPITNYTTDIKGYNVENIHVPETVVLEGNKVWADANNQDGVRPDEITINIMKGTDVVETIKLTSGSDKVWQDAELEWKSSKLPKYENGVAIVYTAVEEDVPNYDEVTTGDMTKGFVTTNTHKTETVDIPGVKTWTDANNQDGMRPTSITIRLLADGTEVDHVTVTQKDNWNWKFTDLPKYNAGKEVKYTITEDPITNYTTDIKGYDVENIHVPETVVLEGNKVWADANNQDGVRPDEITINIMNGTKVVESIKLTSGADKVWQDAELEWKSSKLPKYENGVAITYTAVEEDIANYQEVTTGDMTKGFVTTNTHTPETVNVAGVKTWNDANNQDGMRPASITINLLKDGKEIDEVTVTANDNWSWEFKDLPKYENGKLISYTITEDPITNYTTEVDGYNVKNNHETEKVNIHGEKTWDDNKNQDGKRPVSIKINLLKNGTIIDTVTVTEADNWSWDWTGLDKYEGGKLITYTISEEEVENYTTTYPANTFNVVNHYTPDKVTLNGTKTWQDNNNQDGIRPVSITIHLFKNGTEIDKKVVTEDDKWTWSFGPLDKYEAGKLIDYTITEDVVTGYKTTINKYDVINEHVPETVTIAGTKTWNELDLSSRPQYITVNLYADGVKIDSRISNEDNGWTWNFGELPKFKAGKLINYTIDEDIVPGYVSVPNGFDITNDQVNASISKKSITGSKELAGATLKVVKINNDGTETLIDKWESNGKTHMVYGLADGTYKLIEETAPKGYVIAEEVTFKVVKGAIVNQPGNSLTMLDKPTDVTITKTDITGSKELDGAHLQLFDSAGTLVEEWDSDSTQPHQIVAKLAAGATYRLVETQAPAGYTIAEEITFTVNKDGTPQVVKMKDDVSRIYISKKAIAGKDELEGATLKIVKGTDENGPLAVQPWVSQKTPKLIEQLPDGVYTLVEITAPQGFAVAESITFTIKDGKVVGTKDDTITMYDAYEGDVVISKKSISGADELEGATLKVVKIAADGTETLVDKWISGSKPRTITGLLDGKYKLIEETAPNGHLVAESIEFVIFEGKVTNAGNNTITMLDKPTKVTISKKDITNSDEIGGAHLIVKDADDNIVDEWDSVAGQSHAIEGKLNPGATYTLIEQTAPNGYLVAESITFTLDKDGNVVGTKDNVVTMFDTPTKVTISKKDITNSQEIDGAHLIVKDDQGNILDEWDSVAGKSHDIQAKLVSGVKYTLIEQTAPNGYIVAESISFTLDKAGKVVGQDDNTITMFDTPTNVTISKLDITNSKEIGGAQLIVKDAKGNTIDEWKSVKGQNHVINGKLNPGETYTLTELTAPNGYIVAETVTFTLDKAGKVVGVDNNVVKMFDTPTDVTISKKDITNSDEIGGAHLVIKDSAGNVIDEWDSEAGKSHQIVGKLIPGRTYTLTETTAPDGYLVAESVSFVVNADGKPQVVEMFDTPTTVVVSKKDITNSDEIGGAHLVVKDAAGKIIDEWDSVAGVNHAIVGKLIPGQTYTLTETTAPDGYLVAESVTFTVNKDGKPQAVEMFDERVKVYISKKAIAGTDELEGASLKIVRGSDPKGTDVVEAWTSGKTAKVIELMKDGVYTLVEITAPKGFDVAESMTFTIKDGKVVGTTDNHITMYDAYLGDIIISKKSITGVDELEGATLKIMAIANDGSEKLIAQWVSGSTPKSISGLLDGKYKLVEETAPQGHLVAESIEFVIYEGKVQNFGNNTVTMLDKPTDVTISKKDITNSDEIAGAHLVVKDSKGNIIDEWDSEAGKSHQIVGKLNPGETYTLTETTAPDGYYVAETVTFTVNKDGTPQVVEMFDTPTNVSISKKDITNSKEIGGAHLVVKDDQGNIIDQWDSEEGKSHAIVAKFIPGKTYTLIETTAPDGYYVTEEVQFTVNTDGKPQVVEMFDTPTKVVISKKDITNSDEIEGAHLIVKDENDIIVDQWISEAGKSHEINGKLIAGKTYTLIEETAPNGYFVAEEVQFTVKADGTPTVVEMFDTPTKITVSKKDITNSDEIAGAHLVIKDAKGNTIDEWDSEEGKSHVIVGKLIPGQTYTLTETTAPDGYFVAETVTFTVNKDGKPQVVEMFDTPTHVSISKKDITNSNEIGGAHLIVEDDQGNIVDEWDSVEGQSHAIVKKLIPGKTYTLKEITAPDGYYVTEEVQFTVNTDGKPQVVEMFDTPTKVVISKKDITNSDEIAGAHLVVKDAAGKVIDEWDSEAGKSHEITGKLVAGKTYTLTEITAPDGYLVAETVTFTVTEDGKPTVVEMFDERVKVYISKKAISGVDELEGAELKVVKGTDPKGTDVVAAWTSGKTEKVIELMADGDYTLVETTAPNGFAVAESMTFTIKDGKVVGTADNHITMYDAYVGDVVISKKSITGVDELEGATLKVIKIEGTKETLVAQWVSASTPKTISGLLDGKYRLVEETAPNGYLVAESIEFEIVEGVVKAFANNTVTMYDTPTKISVSKKDITNSEEIAGAHLVVKDSEGNIIDEWDSVEGQSHAIIGKLNPGETYTLTEITAPDGYFVAESVTFTVNNSGVPQVVEMFDTPTNVSISKKDITNSKEIGGAHLIVKDSKGNIIDEWDSEEGKSHAIVGKLNPGETYTLTEITAPDGYYVAEEVQFTVNKDGKPQVVEMFDTPTKVVISKKDITNSEEIAGAFLIVKDENGLIIDQWQSEAGKSHEINGKLIAGKTYTLTEQTAPDGYLVAETVTFTVDESGKPTVVEMFDERVKVYISKKAISGVDELEGAQLKVVKGNKADGKDIVASWTSGKTEKVIELMADGVYTLVETTAPNGFAVAESITFTIKDGKVVGAADNRITMYDAYVGDVVISKKAISGVDELEGATLKVIKLEGNKETLIEKWISLSTPKTITGLLDGKYRLVEETAPYGYLVAESIDFEIVNGVVVGHNNNTVTMFDKPTDITVSKKDITNSKEIAGAHLVVKDKDGNIVDAWTSEEGKSHAIVGKLKPGETYTLTEITAPDGYYVAETIEFTVNKDGKPQVVEMFDTPTKVTVSKKDITNSEEIAGAQLIVKDTDGNVIDQWTSEAGKSHEINGKLVAGKTYTLTEITAPDGYYVAEVVEFTVNEDGKPQVVEMFDAPTKVVVSKKDITDSEEIEGAHLVITDEQGNLVDEWTSEAGKSHEINGKLVAGKTYTLTEITAPDGYFVAESIEFTVNEDGTPNVVEMFDAPTKVTVSKKDITNSEEIEGAHLVVKDAKGNVIDEWDSEAGKSHEINGKLNPGQTYTLTEITAPAGYQVAETIEFTINEDGKPQVVEMFDKPTEVEVSKVDDNADWVVGAHLVVTDSKGKIIDEWDTEENVVHVMTGKLSVGEVYTITETYTPEGYRTITPFEFVVEEGDAPTVLTVVDALAPYVPNGPVYISKTDITGDKEIGGAHLVVTDKNGKVIDEWNSIEGNSHPIDGEKLVSGETYTLTETIAPEGYAYAESIDFAVEFDANKNPIITVNGVVVDKVVMKDDVTKVVVSKKDITNGDEIEGAHLVIKDKDGKVVDEWDSEAGKSHEINGKLIAGEKYTLTEITAPDGYYVAETIEFTVKPDGSITAVEMVDAPTKVVISKKDITNGDEIEGAHLIIQDSNKNVVDEWDSEAGKSHEINGKLIAGEKYTLTEITAPDGYYVAETIEFTVNPDGTPTVVEMFDKPTNVEFSKEDITGKEIPGAHLVLKDAKGNVVDEWTSEKDKTHKITGKLVAGEKYTLTEITAPDGYYVAETIEFTVNPDGSVTKVVMVDAPTKVVVSKKDITNGEEIAGAHLVIKDKDGKVVDEWDSEAGKSHEINGKLIAGEKYTLTEITAPDGYYVAETIEFTVNPDGTPTVVEMFDKPTQVVVSKTDITNGKEIEGAHLVIKDAKGKVVDEWDSEAGKSHIINGKLNPGQTYTLTEITAPDGYYVAETIEFTINEDGTPTVVEMVDAPTNVVISKVDIAGKEIPGAKLIIKDSKGNIVDEWVSEKDKSHIITGKLIAGETYTLIETQAPNGYDIAESITFKVNPDGTVVTKVVMVDGYTPEVPTGDDTNIAGLVSVAIASLGCVYILLVDKRRRAMR